jgi:hypothetical protein
MRSCFRPLTRKFAIEKRLQKVCELYCSGKSQWQIAGALGVNQATISRDLSALRIEWQSRRADVLDGRVAEELAKIDNLEREAWRAWYESCKDIKVRRVSRRGKLTTEEFYRRTQSGDPRFLQQVSRSIEMRSNLLGFFRAKTVHVSAEVECVEISDEERQAAFQRIIAEMAVEMGGSAASAPPPEPSPIAGAIDAAESSLP